MFRMLVTVFFLFTAEHTPVPYSPHGEGAHALGDHPVPVDGRGLRHRIHVGAVGLGRHVDGALPRRLDLPAGRHSRITKAKHRHNADEHSSRGYWLHEQIKRKFRTDHFNQRKSNT